MPASASSSIAAPLAAIVAELDAAERGFLLGIMQSRGTGDIAAALSAPARDRCATAAAAIARLTRPDRVRLVGLLARDALAPLPAGIENVHPDTLSPLLEEQSSETLRLIAVAGRSPGAAVLRAACAAVLSARLARTEDDRRDQSAATTVSPEALADLQRAVLAPIVAVPPAPQEAQSRRWALRLVAMAPSKLVEELTAAGAEVLGTSLGGADDETLRRAAAHVEAPWSERIVRSARAEINDDGGDDSAARGRRTRARQLVAATTPARDPRATLEALGACAVGERLAREDPDLALAVAQRLPAELGRRLLAVATEGR